MAGRDNIDPLAAEHGGEVRSSGHLRVAGAFALLGAAFLFAGCKSAPPLTAAQAQALIQAKYDQSPPVGAAITINDLGMRQGAAAKYWDRTKVYPNKYWADFTLTDNGKKALTLPGGGAVIQWRPESPEDMKYFLIVTTLATDHLKARDVKDPQDDVGGTKSAVYTESISLNGVPGPLADIAHNPGNKLRTKKTATFALDGGVWKLQSIN